MKTGAIVVAAGRGKRMGAERPKQYLLLKGKPVLYYALKAFEESSVDEVVLVVGKGEVSYCQKEIVEAYGLKKVAAIVEGGQERHHSVYRGLQQLEGAGYVLIHDGARPFVTALLIEALLGQAQAFQACVAGVPVKDTIKLVDESQFVEGTPERSRVWIAQTPQAFGYELVWKAYQKLFAEGAADGVTDDAMVVEKMLGHPVKLVEADYRNIKITTPEDLAIGESLLADGSSNGPRGAWEE